MPDIFEQARNKIGPALIHSFFNSPGSYSKGGRYFILSPLRSDSHVGSFSIDEETGIWYDYAGGDGGDFIELVSRSRGIELKEAAEQIIRESGGVFIESAGEEKKKTKKKEYPDPIKIPDTDDIKKSLSNRTKDKWIVDHWGSATKATLYRNESGEGCFYVVRFEKPNKANKKKRDKNDILFYLASDNKWYSHWHEKLQPFPLLGIDKIKDNDLPCLIVEGEKCGKIKVPGYNVITWIGGSSNMKKSDWRPLKGRDLVIWPDADSEMDKNKEFFLPREEQPGMKAAFYIKSIHPKAKILEVYKFKPIENNPAGWDIADFVEEKGDPVKFIEDHLPYNSLAVDIDPYAVYRGFIEHYYNDNELDQINGGYWQYRADLHYWEQVMKPDLICNLQRWMEDTGLQWIVSKKTKVTSFINEVKQYLDRHSLGYYTDNPFKDSALSPYIHFSNGAIKIGTGEFEWFSRSKHGEDFFKNHYPIHCLDFKFDYSNHESMDPKEDCPAFYYFVKEMIPKEEMEKAEKEGKTEELIQEALMFFGWIIAYSIYPMKPNEYFFGIYGPERTGKSFLLRILKSIIGEKFCIEKPIQDMDNRFSSSNFWGKKVYIEPDMQTRRPLPVEFIKAYAGDQSLTIEEKNKAPINGVKTSISMFFISNYEFHAKGIEGLSRRLILIPYKNKIQSYDVKLLDKIIGKVPHGKESVGTDGKIFDERSAIVSLAIKAWDKFCTEQDYLAKIPKWAQRDKDAWLKNTNSVHNFLDDRYFSFSSSFNLTRKSLYNEYCDWAEEDGRKPLGKKNFYEEVRRFDEVEAIRMGGEDRFRYEPEYQSNLIVPEKEYKDDIPF